MRARLLNVRLDDDRLRKVRRLRERGVVLSDVVREAIDRRFDELSEPLQPRDARAMLSRILEQHPDPPDLPPRAYDPHDRTQARDAILRRLRRVPARKPR